jgi:predicted amidohydrolase YtcJ
MQPTVLRFQFIVIGTFFFGALGSQASEPPQSSPALKRKVLTGFSRYFPGDPQAPIEAPTEGLAIEVAAHGVISKITPPKHLEETCPRTECEWIDLKGATLFPGLHDTHTHQISNGAMSDRAVVQGSDISEIQNIVREFARQNPQNPWILGRGWNAAGFNGNYPTAADLDAAVSDRPVLLVDSDGHSIWVNTAALQAAEVDASTKDPAGGTVVRDQEGNPSGVFLENAADLIWAATPDSTPEQLERYILSAEKTSIEAGFTSHHGGPVGVATIEAYLKLDQEGRLKQPSYLWADLHADEETFEKYINLSRTLQARPNGKVTISAFKGFVDGVISSYTGALVDPYHDSPSTRGEAGLTQEELNQLVLRANAAGFPVAIHAVGDLGVRMALDAFEESQKILQHPFMNRIEHIEVVHPLDVPRFAKLNVAAAMQPSHMHFRSQDTSYYDERLGLDRLAYAFAWGTLERAGATLLFGTDAPVVPQDAIEALHCAFRRTYRNNIQFHPENRVSPETAVQAMSGSAQRSLMGLPFVVSSGTLREGQLADFVAFQEDPFRAVFKAVNQNPVSFLMIRGEVILSPHTGRNSTPKRGP